MESKVLLKELPFATVGTIIDKMNGRFSVDLGETLYDGSLFRGASNGEVDFSENENCLIDAIWDNEKWFANVTLGRPQWSVGKSISINFGDHIHQRDLIRIAKGILKTLSGNYKGTVEKMGWTDSAFTDIDFDGRS